MKNILIAIFIFVYINSFLMAKDEYSCTFVDVNKSMTCAFNKLDRDLREYKKDDLIIANDYILIAEEVYARYGSEFLNYKIALEYFFKALTIKKKLYGRNHLEISYIYSRIGAQYYMLDNYTEAIKYYKKAIDSDLENKGIGVFYHYSDLASAYGKLKKYSMAIKYYEMAINSNKYNIRNYRGLVSIYRQQEKYARVIDTYQIILSLRIINKDTEGILDAYLALSSAYKNQNNYNEAMKYLKKFADNDKSNGKYRFSGSYKELAEFFYKKKQFKQSLHYYQIHQEIYQGLSSIETKKIEHKILDLKNRITIK